MDDNLGPYEFEGNPSEEIEFLSKYRNNYEQEMKFVRN